MSAYPDMSEVKRTARQKKQNKRLSKANEIVAAIKADPVRRDAAQLRLNVPGNKLRHALLKEQLLLLSSEG